MVRRPMCDMRLNRDAIKTDSGVSASYCFAGVFKGFATFLRNGFIEYDEHSLMIPSTGRLLLRHLVMAFDTYRPAHHRWPFSRFCRARKAPGGDNVKH